MHVYLAVLFFSLFLTKWFNQMVKVKSDQNTEERILEAARNVLFAKGFSGARMQDIADEAGINKALLHYYFRSKDKLFEVVFTDAVSKLLPRMLAIFEDQETHIFDKIRNFCALYIRTWIEHPLIPMFVLHEIHAHEGAMVAKIVGKLSGNPVQAVMQSIETAVRKKQIKPIAPPQLMLNIMSLCIFPFVGRPIFKKVVGIPDKQYAAMLEARVTEVSEFIIDAIKYKS